LNYPISAKIITDSASPAGNRMTTFELVYPRYLHGEIMTHRLFGRNAQSSRAVPVTKTIAVNKQAVEPLIWGQNVAGMQSKGALEGWRLSLAKFTWRCASNTAFAMSKVLAKLGLHKQWANRITEPFSTIKIICTATEWNNFFWLRLDEAAVQPEMFRLATEMKQAYDMSLPVQLQSGQWHTPYVDNKILEGQQVFFDTNGKEITLEETLRISASCCAQVSYRNLDESLEKANAIFDKLFSGPKPHMSPTEHQGRVMQHEKFHLDSGLQFDRGVTALDKDGNYLSANLKGFCQFRHLLGKPEDMFKFLKEEEYEDK
jgi:hypothetical protein